MSTENRDDAAQVTTNGPEQFSLRSVDLVNELKEILSTFFPEAFADGKLDAQRLQESVGDVPEGGRERYALTWAGKADAIRAIQHQTRGTLNPDRASSIDFDTARHVLVEGDNLEVLKLLQRSYHAAVKLIYIDPPYNTGTDFIYPDNFREGLDEYLKFSGQVSSEGVRLTTNSETSGRYHSRWLSMMYPRLFLARQLLQEDGLIFVSIDDHEVHNLRLLMNEIFGEESFVAQIVWKSRKFPDARAKTRVSIDHEYILVYSRAAGAGLRGIERDETKFSNPDDHPLGPWMSRSILGLATKKQRPNLHYTITDPATGNTFDPPAATGWRYEEPKMLGLITDGRILFPNSADGRPREKKFRNELESEFISFPTLIDDVHTADGTKEIRDLFGFQAFDFPKPTELIRRFVEQTTSDDDVVLDFFAGSGTTFDATVTQNRRDGGSRRVILVQLPEPLATGSEAVTQGYTTLAALCVERVRRFATRFSATLNDELKSNEADHTVNVGLKVFKLAPSNFSTWARSVEGRATAEQLEAAVLEFADHVRVDAKEENVLFELLVKSGIDYNASIEVRTVAEQRIYWVGNGDLAICLEPAISFETMRALADLQPRRVLCLDNSFAGNDQLKTNSVLEMKNRQIQFQTV
jgi:adenine-specific DNA-methyltransferase